MDSNSPKGINKNKVQKKVKEYNVDNKQKENQDKKNNLNKNDEEDVKLEEEIPEDIDIQEDEFQRILVGGAESSDKYGKNNSKNSKQATKRKKKKKPFVISVIEDSSYKKIKIIINANTFRDESLMPIWCPKNSYIKFQVKGKWRIGKLFPYTDSKGLPSSNNTGGFGYGALVGRIGNGDKFVVADDKAVMAKEGGALYLKQLLPKNMEIDPEGSLEVNVFDGEYMNYEEINKKIGWIENNTINVDENNQEENNGKKLSKKEIEEKEKTEFETKIRNEFNNLRMNPLLSYDQYISKTRNLTQTRKYLEIFNDTYLQALNPVEEYYEDIFNYFKLFAQNSNKINIKKNNVTDYLLGLEGEMGYYLTDKFQRNVKVKCRLTKKTNPRDIIIQCFYDKKYIFFIFNKKSQDLTVNTFKNYYKDFTLIIMAFTFESNDSNEKEE